MIPDDPLGDPRRDTAKVLTLMNYFFTTVFVFEMLVKKVAFGVILGEEAYWRQNWNKLDGIVVLVSVIDLSGVMDNVSVFRTLRVLRALRPLRVISRNPNLKLVVNTLFKSVPELCNLLIVGSLFFLIFGLFALNYFKGTFYA